MTRGLPASGKTTFALEMVRTSQGKVKRINKDDLRAMIDGGVWSKEKEAFVLEARNHLVQLAIRTDSCNTIIIDDTNFEDTHIDSIKSIIAAYNSSIKVTIKDFTDVPLDICIERDAKREKPVGEKVIKDMHRRYIMPHLKETYANVSDGNAIICDIDGCAAHRTDRNWFDLDKVHTDLPDHAVRNIVNSFYERGYTVLFVSGREGTEICQRLTAEWLKKNDFKHHALYMRAAGDYRRDSIVKQEIYEKHIKDRHVVEFVLDDRQQVVDMWRSIGLKCLQVEPGDF